MGKLKNKKIIAVLAKYPDFSKYKRITLKSLLKIKGIGKKGAFFLLKRLNNIEYMPGLTDIYQTIIFSYAKRILELQKEIEDIDRKLDEIGEKNKCKWQVEMHLARKTILHLLERKNGLILLFFLNSK